MVEIPNVQGVSERLQRVYKKYNINVAMRPHNALKNLLVHPNDKRDTEQTREYAYEIPYENCNKSYVGETGRAFGIRLIEHRKEAEQIARMKYTRATRKDSLDKVHKSVISDHVAQQNHLIGRWQRSFTRTQISKQDGYEKPYGSGSGGRRTGHHPRRGHLSSKSCV